MKPKSFLSKNSVLQRVIFIGLVRSTGGYPSHWSLVYGPRCFPGGYPSLWSQFPSEGIVGTPVQVLARRREGGTLVRTSTWVPPTRTRTGVPPSPLTQHAMDRIRRGRYASCGDTGGLSCYSSFLKNQFTKSAI